MSDDILFLMQCRVRNIFFFFLPFCERCSELMALIRLTAETHLSPMIKAVCQERKILLHYKMRLQIFSKLGLSELVEIPIKFWFKVGNF